MIVHIILITDFFYRIRDLKDLIDIFSFSGLTHSMSRIELTIDNPGVTDSAFLHGDCMPYMGLMLGSLCTSSFREFPCTTVGINFT